MDLQDQGFGKLGLSKQMVGSPQLCCYTRDLDKVSTTSPLLVLLHGYPETSYMWRLTVPLFPKSFPLFVPDLPGYGLSAPLEENDKLSVGSHILHTISNILPSGQENPLILIGHDRGGRVAHRLTVSWPSLKPSHLTLLGTCVITVIDIVPTTVQWRAFGISPQTAVDYWHWPFLATSMAPEIILAFGGGSFVARQMQTLTRKLRVKSPEGIEVYHAAFNNPSVVRASCADYASGATVDVEAQREDQEAGRKVSVPLLALHGAEYINKVFDVKKEWSEWVADKGLLYVHCASGVGHFVPEEAPEETVEVILGWLKDI